MSLDITLLRLMTDRKRFDRLITGLPDAGLEESTREMIADIRAYYTEFKEATALDLNVFDLWMQEFRHSNWPDDRKSLASAQIRQMATPVSEEVADTLMERLISAECSVALLDIISRWDDGGEFDLLNALTDKLSEYEQVMERKVSTPFVEDDIEELLAEDDVDGGLSWRLTCLAQSMRNLRDGDFGIIAGRPDKGKTTFLTSELSHMVPQLVKLYQERGEELRPIIWFNNEGPGKRIKQRYFQSLLGCTLPEMVTWLRDGSLRQRLFDAAGGVAPDSVLKIVDVHDAKSHEIEHIIRTNSPHVVVFDMIDNVHFSGGTTNNGTRTDQLLEEMYKWGRNIAVKYHCVGLATSQISADGDGLPYPTLPMLKDSKTGKQGAADFIITIGALNDPAFEDRRYIGMTKNKLHRFGFPKDPRCEVVFDPDHARYSDPVEI